MKERSFDEMIAYFNRRVSEMDISQDCKMELLGMVTALGYKHEKSVPQWIPCSEPPTEHGFYHEILLYGKDGNYAVGWYDEDYFTWDDRFDMDTPVAWCKLPEPWRGEEHESV